MRWTVLAAVLVFVVLPAVGVIAGWARFNGIDRVDLGQVLSPAGDGGTNYLVVGSDSREGIDESDPNSGAFIGTEVFGERTDTIMVLRLAGEGTRLLSIPRDLWVVDASTGAEGRINATFQNGPAVLVSTVQRSLGIPIHHYLQIDFGSFGGLVDAVGGVTVEFPYPARDRGSGLLIEETGPVTLDGEEALAYVRSRTYTELVDGVWRTDPTGDLGRVERQRALLTQLLGDLASTRNPVTLFSVTGALAGGMKIDDSIGFLDSIRLALDLRGFAPAAETLPVFDRVTSGGAAVLELRQPDAAELLVGYGGAPPA